MKRITAFILILLYLGTSTGATMHFHYCMGELAKSSIWGGNEKKCPNCGMNKEDGASNGCCDDDIYWIKLRDDQKSSFAVIEISKCLTDQYGIPELTATPAIPEKHSHFPKTNPLLRSPQSPAYLLNCVFRI